MAIIAIFAALDMPGGFAGGSDAIMAALAITDNRKMIDFYYRVPVARLMTKFTVIGSAYMIR